MNSEIKNIFLKHALEIPKKELFAFYNGVLPQSTIYKWYKELESNNNYYIQYNDDVLRGEWNRLLKENRGYGASPNTNKIILHHQPHFYRVERLLLNNENIKRKITLNRVKYLKKDPNSITNKELLLGFKISGIYKGFSHFSPYWAKQFIQDNKCASVYDPCGGWGHRLLGVCSSPNTYYYYNDFWKETFNGIGKIVNFLNIHNVDIFNNKSEHFIPDFKYDSIFTCPPYFNKEKYSEKSFKNYNDFYEWWAKTMECSIIEGVKTIGICIDLDNIEIIKAPILKKGYNLKTVKPLGPNNKMHYNKTKRDTRDHLLVFSK